MAENRERHQAAKRRRLLIRAARRRAGERLVLPDGGRLRVRPFRPSDADRLCELVRRQSPDTLYRRFFTTNLEAIAALRPQLMQIDGDRRRALVALHGAEIVAVARYHRESDGDEAEVAVLVDERWQGRGLGTRLLSRLAAEAAERHVSHFLAFVLGENRRALRLMHAVFDSVQFRIDSGEYVGRAVVASRRAFPPPAPPRERRSA